MSWQTAFPKKIFLFLLCSLLLKILCGHCLQKSGAGGGGREKKAKNINARRVSAKNEHLGAARCLRRLFSFSNRRYFIVKHSHARALATHARTLIVKVVTLPPANTDNDDVFRVVFFVRFAKLCTTTKFFVFFFLLLFGKKDCASTPNSLEQNSTRSSGESVFDRTRCDREQRGANLETKRRTESGVHFQLQNLRWWRGIEGHSRQQVRIFFPHTVTTTKVGARVPT